MNFFRSIIAWFRNRYEGATYSTTRSAIPSAVQSARFDAGKAVRLELVRKSRYFEKNNPIYNRLCDIWELYIAGAGLPLTPATSNPTFNESAAASFEQWSDLCDFQGRQSFSALQSMWARAWFVDGEVFVILTKGETGRPRLQTLEAHQVCTPPELFQEEGKSVVDGVSIDKNGRVLGYWVETEGDAVGKKKYELYDRSVVVHLFEPSRPGQYRGIPLCHAVINELHDLDDLHLLEMQAAKENATVARFIQTDTGEVDDAEMFRSGGTTADTDGKKRAAYYEKTIGANVKALFPGDKVQQFAGERPSVVTRDYWRYKTELVCAGIGIPVVMVFPDSIQGTVYRGALDMAALFFRARSATFAAFLRRIYVFWCGNDILGQRPKDWQKVSIATPRSPNVDVGRNSAAMLAELEAGCTTYDQVYGPLGLDWREAFRKLKEQQDYAREIGLELPSASQPEPAPQGGNNVGA